MSFGMDVDPNEILEGLKGASDFEVREQYCTCCERYVARLSRRFVQTALVGMACRVYQRAPACSSVAACLFPAAADCMFRVDSVRGATPYDTWKLTPRLFFASRGRRARR